MPELNFEESFPKTIAPPAELIQLRAWLERRGYPISGHFELRADEREGAIFHWFGTDAVLDRLATFGVGPDGSPYAIWLQDDGRTPVVHMGSEGQNNFVLAADFPQFLRLLAVGYGEIGFDDLTRPPESEGINPEFQTWVKQTFLVSIPEVGNEITRAARDNHQDFESWIQRILG